jgi:hypothetical protein
MWIFCDLNETHSVSWDNHCRASDFLTPLISPKAAIFFTIQCVIYTPAKEEATTTGIITAQARQSSGTMPNRSRKGV